MTTMSREAEAIKKALAEGHTEWARLFCEKEIGHAGNGEYCSICQAPMMLTVICDHCGRDLGSIEPDDIPIEMQDSGILYSRCPMGSHQYES